MRLKFILLFFCSLLSKLCFFFRVKLIPIMFCSKKKYYAVFVSMLFPTTFLMTGKIYIILCFVVENTMGKKKII